MATYFIGDLQGCFDALQALLNRISFDPEADHLYFTGDLVNRGGEDLKTLRFLVAHAKVVDSVLGNHDLHLLAAAAGVREVRKHDTFGEVLEAPDAEHLLGWLCARPLLLRTHGRVLVHAGLLPAWDLGTAETLARALEAKIRGGELASLISGPHPRGPFEALGTDRERLALALDAFVSLRFVDAQGCLVPEMSSAPENAPPGLFPWFAVPDRKSRALPLVHGHWASLGVRMTDSLWSIDGGCVWGGTLCAVRAEDGQAFKVKRPAPSQEAPQG